MHARMNWLLHLGYRVSLPYTASRGSCLDKLAAAFALVV